MTELALFLRGERKNKKRRDFHTAQKDDGRRTGRMKWGVVGFYCNVVPVCKIIAVANGMVPFLSAFLCSFAENR